MITLKVSKSEVYKEVAKTTGYVGAKMQGDETAYDRISTTDENQELLERFWNESRAVVIGRLKGLVASEKTEDEEYTLTLNPSSAFDVALQSSMEQSLMSYFVLSIVVKWFVVTNKGETEQYSTQATAMLEDVREKAFYKKAPMRPVYKASVVIPSDQQQVNIEKGNFEQSSFEQGTVISPTI